LIRRPDKEEEEEEEKLLSKKLSLSLSLLSGRVPEHKKMANKQKDADGADLNTNGHATSVGHPFNVQ